VPELTKRGPLGPLPWNWHFGQFRCLSDTNGGFSQNSRFGQKGGNQRRTHLIHGPGGQNGQTGHSTCWILLGWPRREVSSRATSRHEGVPASRRGPKGPLCKAVLATAAKAALAAGR